MVDIAALAIALIVVVVVMLRKTSAGVAILALFAGLMIDQLLGAWVIDLLPQQSTVSSTYILVIVRILLTFTPMAVALVAVKVPKHNAVLSILTSLMLGFLITYFGLKVLAPIPAVALGARNSGLLMFLNPYQTLILAIGTLFAMVEMILSHRKGVVSEKKSKK